MSQEEKGNLISLVTTLLVSVPYLAYLLLKFQGKTFTTQEELKFWATAMLILIPIRIVGEIVMHIITAIITAIVTGKEDKDLIDERDKLIDLKSNRNSYYFFCIGFMISMIALVFDQSVSVMFIILIISSFFAEIIDIFSKIYYYRKGL